MRPVCVKCGLEMVKEFAGVLVAELYLGNTAIYKLWYADYYQCKTCQTIIIHSFAEQPYWQSHEKGRDGQRDFAIEEAKKKGLYFEVKES